MCFQAFAGNRFVVRFERSRRMQSPAAMGDGQQQQQQWTMMQTPQPGSQPQNHEEVKTLWVGDLQYWVEESYLHNCFAHTGEVRSSASKTCLYLLHLLCTTEETSRMWGEVETRNLQCAEKHDELCMFAYIIHCFPLYCHLTATG